MTPQEFKAWFDGFTEAIDKVPTQKQWARIKARVAEIDGLPITYPVYVDRYIRPSMPSFWYWNGNCTTNTTGPTLTSSSIGSFCSGTRADVGFNSISAMKNMGQIEAAALENVHATS